MPPEELDFSRTKLAVETRLKRADQRLAKAQFELERKKQSVAGWKIFLTPTGAAIAAAALGLLGTAAAKWADWNVTKKNQETTIILRASDVPPTMSAEEQERQRARNLLWFANAKYIDLPEGSSKQLTQIAQLRRGEALPPPIVQSAGGALSGFVSDVAGEEISSAIAFSLGEIRKERKGGAFQTLEERRFAIAGEIDRLKKR